MVKARSGRLVNDPLAQQLPLVSGKWLLWSLLAIFGGGLALVYLTVCLLFWQGQWQILFKPGRAESQWPTSAGVPFQDLRFASAETGQPSLNGWLVPAGSSARSSRMTVLYLHGMDDGSLSDTVPGLVRLHRLGVSIFAFDYRGFGYSASAKPSERLATEDTEAAWEYLVDTRHVPAASIVLYGKELGASLAAQAAARHPDAAALILDTPAPVALDLLRSDSRSRWLPVRLLAQDSFDPTHAFASVRQPMLFLLPPPPADAAGRAFAGRASDPKMIVSLPPGDATASRLEALRRFLDELPQH